MTFGAMLRDARHVASKTLREVAHSVEWSLMYVSDVERGRRPPPPDMAKISTVAAFLGADAEALKVQACRERGFVPLPPGATDERIATVLRWLDDDLMVDRESNARRLRDGVAAILAEGDS